MGVAGADVAAGVPTQGGGNPRFQRPVSGTGLGEVGTVVDVEEDVVVHVTHAAACAAAATTSVAGVWTAPPPQVGQRFHPTVPVEETACGHTHGTPGGEAVPVRLSGGGP